MGSSSFTGTSESVTTIRSSRRSCGMNNALMRSRTSGRLIPFRNNYAFVEIIVNVLVVIEITSRIIPMREQSFPHN